MPRLRLQNAYAVWLFPTLLRSAAPKKGSLSPFCHGTHGNCLRQTLKGTEAFRPPLCGLCVPTIPFPCVPWLFPTRRNSDAHQTKFRCPSEKFLMGIRKRSDGHQKVLQCPLDGPVAPNALNPTAVTLSPSAATSETALTSAVQTTLNMKGHNSGRDSPSLSPLTPYIYRRLRL